MLSDFKKILVVDDEREVVEFLKKGLVREGFEVITAYDGIQAKDKILREEPDVILLDLIMPEIDGWAVLKWLKERDLKIPTIIVSAKDEIKDIKRGVSEADTYLVKPINISDVLRGINIVCSLQSEKDGRED